MSVKCSCRLAEHLSPERAGQDANCKVQVIPAVPSSGCIVPGANSS